MTQQHGAPIWGAAFGHAGVDLAVGCCLRLIGVRFRKDLSVRFGKRDLARARQGFERWFELVKDKVPADRRDAIYASTEQEFLLFNEQIFRSPEADAISTLPPSL